MTSRRAGCTADVGAGSTIGSGWRPFWPRPVKSAAHEPETAGATTQAPREPPGSGLRTAWSQSGSPPEADAAPSRYLLSPAQPLYWRTMSRQQTLRRAASAATSDQFRAAQSGARKAEPPHTRSCTVALASGAMAGIASASAGIVSTDSVTR